MSALNENEEETDGEESRPASRKPSSTKRMSVLSNGGSGASRVSDPCTIRHMKIKERSCSERSDSGFSECATHSPRTCTCEKKSFGSDEGVKRKVNTALPDIELSGVSTLPRPLNHSLLKDKLERIASLQFDEEENIVVTEPTRSPTDVPDKQAVPLPSTSSPKPTPSTLVMSPAESVKSSESDAGSKVELRSDSIKSELDYDIKRYNLDGSSVRSRKKSLENQAKKELSIAPTKPASIKVSTRVSELKCRFDSAPILPAIFLAKAAKKEYPSVASHVSTMKITLDRESTRKGNESF